jgi:hypothetical protein
VSSAFTSISKLPDGKVSCTLLKYGESIKDGPLGFLVTNTKTEAVAIYNGSPVSYACTRN